MSAVRPTLRSIPPQPAPAPADVSATLAIEGPRTPAEVAPALSWFECTVGFVVLVLWLGLFAAGILVDTEPYRRQISPTGVDALNAEAGQVQAAAATPATSQINRPTPIVVTWLIVLSCFVPLNLAWLCVSASVLGTFGNLANLGEDDGQRHRDSTNPYTSAFLRGFFVYLFMMSGLLVLDDAPFSNTGPGQYIRLAGFLSLFSFVVSYQPRMFSSLLLSAFQRIQARGVEHTSSIQAHSQSNTIHANVDADRGTVDVAVIKQSSEKGADESRG